MASQPPLVGDTRVYVPRPHRRTPVLTFVHLIRPRDSSIAFFATFVGARLAGVEQTAGLAVVLLAVSNMLLIAASMAFNDWHDVGEDAINRPDAPVSSGRVLPQHAMLIGLAGFALAIASASAVSRLAGLLAAAFVLGSVAYTVRLKRTMGVGNALVASLSSYPIWCWMLLAGSVSQVYVVLTAACVVFNVGREFLGTARDAAGDRAEDIPTVATTYGVPLARRLGAGLMALGGLLAVQPLLVNAATLLYAVLLSISWTMVVYIAIQAFRKGSADRESSARLISVTHFVTLLMAVAYGLGVRVG